MSAELIDGTAIAAKVQARVAEHVASLARAGVTPGLTVVLVGDDPASAVYVASKERTCRELGMAGETIRLPSATPHDELVALIDRLNADETVHGILVQMPLPSQIRADVIIERIRPDKDVDGFHPVNMGKLFAGQRDGFVPCTPAGVIQMLEDQQVEVRGKECVIVGRSNIVGKPMAALLLRHGKGGDGTVTVCHSGTADLGFHTRRAEILIVAAGRPRMITGDMIMPGAVVIDVGVNRIADSSKKSGTRLVGDVDFDSAREVASKITPVPGGVGKMTIAMLMRNTARAAAHLHQQP